jgi:hypothetical protein
MFIPWRSTSNTAFVLTLVGFWGEKCLVAVDLEMKSNCIVISSRSNDEIEIFEDEEVTTDEKNKATRDLHDLSIPVYGRPKATLHAEELVKLCFGEVDSPAV